MKGGEISLVIDNHRGKHTYVHARLSEALDFSHINIQSRLQWANVQDQTDTETVSICLMFSDEYRFVMERHDGQFIIVHFSCNLVFKYITLILKPFDDFHERFTLKIFHRSEALRTFSTGLPAVAK